jgi:hypothetical protein
MTRQACAQVGLADTRRHYRPRDRIDSLTVAGVRAGLKRPPRAIATGDRHRPPSAAGYGTITVCGGVAALVPHGLVAATAIV